MEGEKREEENWKRNLIWKIGVVKIKGFDFDIRFDMRVWLLALSIAWTFNVIVLASDFSSVKWNNTYPVMFMWGLLKIIQDT
jgi:hypothetical protein